MPLAASESMWGVGMSRQPKLPRSPYPKSSMKRMTTFGLRTRVRLMAGSGREPIVAIVADIAFKKSRRFIVFLVFLSCRFAMKGE
ncbi:MAG: hypothetical protein ACYS9C_20210 [Planctomycetota bacterium]